MALSSRTKKLIAEITSNGTKLGDLKRRAKEIKRDHELALELWDSGEHHPRLLSVLIFDKKLLSQDVVEQLASDMAGLPEAERDQLSEWLLANQLMKDKALAAQLQTWEDSSSPILRRLFWYHQARLRWVGQTPPDNSADLLAALERGMASEEPVVQWAMNFCAGQIGVRESKYRSRCVKLGKKTGLYKDERVAKNCTPSYLPEFIRIEAAKLEA